MTKQVSSRFVERLYIEPQAFDVPGATRGVNGDKQFSTGEGGRKGRASQVAVGQNRLQVPFLG